MKRNWKSESMMMQKAVLCAAGLAVVSVFARDAVWTGGGDGLRWSDPANWGGVAPAAGDVVRIGNDSGDTLSVSNDISGLSLAGIVCDGSYPVSLSGERVALTGGLLAWSNAVETACSMPIEFSPGSEPASSQMFFGGAARFDAEVVSLGASGQFILAGPSNATFNASVLSAGQDVRFTMSGGSSSKDGRASFYAPVNFKNVIPDGFCYGAMLFYATNNVVGTISPVLWTCEAMCANAFAQGTVWSWGTYYIENNPGRSNFRLNGYDQTIDRFGGTYRPADKQGAFLDNCYIVTSTGAATLTLKATADCSTYAHIWENVSVVWDPQGDYTLDFMERVHNGAGTLAVRRGTMRVSDNGAFAKMKAVNVADGAVFDLASTNRTTRPLNAATRITLGANARFVATNRTDAFIADGAATLDLAAGARFVLADGLSQSVKAASVGGIPVAAGTYTGTGGESGTVVDWIEGKGMIVVTENAAGTWWTGATDGDFNKAGNWTDGVPTASLAGHVAKHGTVAVSVAAEPAQAVGDLALENTSGSTTLSVAAPLSVGGTAVSVGKGAEVVVGSGGEWRQDMAGLSAANSTETFSLHNGGRFVVDGGFANITNTVGRLSIGGDSSGDEGVLEIRSGTCFLTRGGGDFVRLGKNGSIVMTGGVLQTDNLNSVGQYGGVIDLSGDARLVSTHNVYHDAVLRTVTAKIHGQAVFKNAGGNTRYFFTPNASGETCLVELDDDGFIDFHNDQLRIGATSGGKTIVKMRGRSRFDAANGVIVGCDRGAYGEIDIGDDAYFRQENYDYGIDLGRILLGSYEVGNPATGVLKMSGGRLLLGRSPNSDNTIQGLIVGNGAFGDYSGPVAAGRIEMTGGVVTNRNNAVFVLGCRSAEGTVAQGGGTIVHDGAWPLLIGFSGGKGTYTMTNGELHASRSSVYVGGASFEQAGYTLAWADRPADGALSVSGGKFRTERSIYVSAGGYGVLEVGSAGHVEAAQNLYLTNSVDAVNGGTATAKLRFVLGADGCGKVVVGGTCQVAGDAQVEIDVSAYAGKRAVELLSCAAMDGAFAPANVSITADNPVLYALEQTSRGLRLICNAGTVLIVR